MSLLLAAIFTPAAHAQDPTDWQFVPGPVLQADPGTSYMALGVGAPSVVYDTIRNRFVMVFESLTDQTDPRCPQGIWALGLATSPDGINWTPYPTSPMIPVPGNGTWHSCAVGHPTALFDPTQFGGNGGILVLAKGEQDTDACNVTVPVWGCNTISGIGRITIQLDAAGDPVATTPSARPVLQPPNGEPLYGYPKIVREPGTPSPRYRVLYQVYPDIWSAWSTNLSAFSAPRQQMEIEKNAVKLTHTWVRNELFSPSLICDDDLYGGTTNYAAFVGGRATNVSGVLYGGWGKATDTVWGGAVTFLLDTTAQQEWNGNDEWRHFDVHALTTGDYLVWFSEKIGGVSAIRFGGTTLTFNNADVVSKICP